MPLFGKKRNYGSTKCWNPADGLKSCGQSIVSSIRGKIENAKANSYVRREKRKEDREERREVRKAGIGKKDIRMGVNYQPNKASWKSYDVLSKSKNV
jgi:hypothetical protein